VILATNSTGVAWPQSQPGSQNAPRSAGPGPSLRPNLPRRAHDPRAPRNGANPVLTRGRTKLGKHKAPLTFLLGLVQAEAAENIQAHFKYCKQPLPPKIVVLEPSRCASIYQKLSFYAAKEPTCVSRAHIYAPPLHIRSGLGSLPALARRSRLHWQLISSTQKNKQQGMSGHSPTIATPLPRRSRTRLAMSRRSEKSRSRCSRTFRFATLLRSMMLCPLVSERCVRQSVCDTRPPFEIRCRRTPRAVPEHSKVAAGGQRSAQLSAPLQ